MARITNIKPFTETTNGVDVKVGHNRTVNNSPADDIIVCKLHGHSVLVLDTKENRLRLDTCGYMTTTTRSAMKDFLDHLPQTKGLVRNVSFAKGVFSVLVNDEWVDAVSNVFCVNL